jgi:hypothetical protein
MINIVDHGRPFDVNHHDSVKEALTKKISPSSIKSGLIGSFIKPTL